MDAHDYNEWTPQRPADDFAKRAVDMMLADSAFGRPPVAPVHCIITGKPIEVAARAIPAIDTPAPSNMARARGKMAPRKIGGALATILAAALVATTAWGMWAAKGALQQDVPQLQNNLPRIDIPVPKVVKAPVVAAPVEVATVEEPPPTRYVAPPKASAEPVVVEPPEPPAPRYIKVPRCDCYNDVSVCGCVD